MLLPPAGPAGTSLGKFGPSSGHDEQRAAGTGEQPLEHVEELVFGPMEILHYEHGGPS
jgi:hypothetical protein